MVKGIRDIEKLKKILLDDKQLAVFNNVKNPKLKVIEQKTKNEVLEYTENTQLREDFYRTLKKRKYKS